MIRFLQTPGPAKKIIFGSIIVVACLGMVTYLIPGGLGGGFGGPGPGVLAKVGDQEITLGEAQLMARNMLRQQFPRGMAGASQLMPFFVQRAVDQLVYKKAMLAEAERLGLRVSDAEVADFLQHGPLASILFPGGQFVGSDHYEQFVQQQYQLTVPAFEQQLKADLLMGKLRTLVESGATVSNDQLRQEYIRKNTKVKFDYAVLTNDDVMKQIKPTEAELKAFYEQNKKRYENAIPEKRVAQYVVIDMNKLKEKVQITPDELKSYYNGHIDEYRVPEEVKARHILIKTPAPGPDGKVDQKAVDAARAKAEGILKQVKAAGNFAELAKKNSEDPGSAQQGGELGWLGRGRTVPEFEKVAFSLKPGETSGLVQSSYGFHIIQVEDKHTAHVKPLEEVKAQIEPAVAAQKAGQKAEALAHSVESQARAGGLANAAKKSDVELFTTPPVARTDSVPGVGAAPEFMGALFEARVNQPAEMVRLPQGYAVLQLTSITPPQTPAFEAIRARVEDDFKRERTAQFLAQKVQELSDRAHAEHNLKKAAAEVGATMKTSELVGPEQQVPDIGSLAGPAAAVFDMKPGEISAPINAGRGGAVIALVEKQEPDPAGFDVQKAQLRETLLGQKRTQLLDLFIESLRQRMEKEGKIRINKQEMDRLLPKQEAS